MAESLGDCHRCKAKWDVVRRAVVIRRTKSPSGRAMRIALCDDCLADHENELRERRRLFLENSRNERKTLFG